MNWYGLAVPKTQEWSPHMASAFVRSVLEDRNAGDYSIHFFIYITQDRTQFLIYENSDQVTTESLISLARAFYPTAAIYLPEFAEMSYPYHRSVTVFERNSDYYVERSVPVENLDFPDPLEMLTQIGEQIQVNERLVFKIHLRGWYAPDDKAIQYLLTQSRAEAGLRTHVRPAGDSLADAFAAGLISGWLDSRNRVPRFSPSVEQLYRTKLTQRMYRMSLMLRLDTPDVSRQHLFTAASAALKRFPLIGEGTTFEGCMTSDDDAEALNENAIWERWDVKEKNKKQDDERWKRNDAHTFYLIPEEIAALWHPPHPEYQASKICWTAKPRPSISATVATNREGIYIGLGVYQSKPHPVFWQQSQRSTHMSVIGKNGTGKSSFLHALIRQDIQAGCGVAVIDPHGDKADSLVRRILQTSIPAGREGDVVVIDLANSEYPPPLNLLATSKMDASPNGAGEVIGLIERVYEDMEATRWRDTLTNLLFTLWQDEQPTLLDVDRLFMDTAYRAKLVAKIGIENFPVLQFWDGFERLSEAGQQLLRQPVTYRLRSLIGNPHLFPMLCHPNSLNFAHLMGQNKIILISLGVDSKTVPEADQNLVAALLIAAFEQAAFGRSSRELFPMYVDEAQRFGASSLARVFAEVRKSGVAFTLAHQYLKQLPEKVREAVFGNVGAIVAFQSNPEDAAYLAKYMRPAFEADDLIQMDKFQAAVWLRQGDKTQPAFALQPPPPISTAHEREGLAREQAIRAQSIAQYTPQPKDAILQWIKTRYLPAHPPTDGTTMAEPPDKNTYG